MKISIIGSGNVGSAIALELSKNNNITDVFSANIKNAKELANKCNANAIDNIKDLSHKADIYIFALKDDVIEDIVRSFPFENKFMVHTSGSVSMNVFELKTERYGVLYPFQTFTKGRKLNFNEIPFCIEANNVEILSQLESFAVTLSSKTYKLSEQQRRLVHLAGVFSCNFTNHLYGLAQYLLEGSNIPAEIIYPLIAETVNKAIENTPKKSQTGPAVRNDEEIIKKHIEILENKTELKEIYKLLSNSIRNLA